VPDRRRANEVLKEEDPTARGPKALTPWVRGKDEGLSEHRPPLAALASGRCRSAGRRLGVRHPATNVATDRAEAAPVTQAAFTFVYRKFTKFLLSKRPPFPGKLQ